MTKKIKIILFTALAAMIVVCAVVFLYLINNNLNKETTTQEAQNDVLALKEYTENTVIIAEQTISKEPMLTGYTIGDVVTVRSEPSEESNAIATVSLNYPIEYMVYNNSWAKVLYAKKDGYVPLKYIGNEKIGSTTHLVNAPSSFKSYMDYRTITNQDSDQYKLQSLYAKTGEYGIRMVNNRYCVAVGSFFGSNIGQYLDIILENGTVIQCIMGDQKDDSHTDANNIYTVHSLCTSEFIVDGDHIPDDVIEHGDISYCSEFWGSKVKEVIIYDKNVFDEE